MRKFNKKTIFTALLVYLYSILAVPAINFRLEQSISDPISLVGFQAIHVIISYILFALAIVTIGREKKRSETLLWEILLIDLPSVWMATLVIQVYLFAMYAGISLLETNATFLTRIGALIAGAEIYRYIRYIKDRERKTKSE